ncbi:Carbohydrate-binding module family 63 protein [Teratosphaeria destructans]|uniref:Carbohydrate-binding module family 63 protein n=1 Tax=Teratosphaeria destructans TaxID=418781 RepID=A0A9W7W2X2_9PEZI|nr:Carbohydrate-binding module family 63 protein [Teratosphaeria destructans]
MAFAAVTPGMTLDERGLPRRSLVGDATFYGGKLADGACSFTNYSLPSGLFGTALSDNNWESAGNCGGCISVQYGNKCITAMIVDECAGCGENHLDLFQNAFAELADISKGTIKTEWEYVQCPGVTGPLRIHTKTGVSKDWFSAQVVNANRRTAKMEVSTDGGSTWMDTTRRDYNFFEIPAGTKCDSAWIRVTSPMGDVVTVKDVPMLPDFWVEADCNYHESCAPQMYTA